MEMEKLRMAMLALAGVLAMPAMAAGDDVTTVGFAKKAHHSVSGVDFIEFTVTKDGPAEVLVLWVTSRGELFLRTDGERAEPGVDFAPMAGQLFFRAEDTAISFQVPITHQTTPVTVEEGKAKNFIVGLALNPLADYGDHTVAFREGGYEYAIGVIQPCFLANFQVLGSC